MEDKRTLQKYARELQKEIMEQLRRRYSPAVIKLWQNPKNFRILDSPSGHAKIQGPCGDTMEMFLKIEDDSISECTFLTDGCGPTIACGSMATELAQNKSFTEALASVSADAILNQLGGLPEENEHCAQLAAETFRRALADFLYKKNIR